jgi:hypothetical protein
MSDSPVRKELKIAGSRRPRRKHKGHDESTAIPSWALWIGGAPDSHRVCDPPTLQLDKVELTINDYETTGNE